LYQTNSLPATSGDFLLVHPGRRCFKDAADSFADWPQYPIGRARRANPGYEPRSKFGQLTRETIPRGYKPQTAATLTMGKPN
jgi:hypothetical protein